MMYLFSESGTKLLESLCFTETLFAFDFDGTLSKIVREPGAATISNLTKDLISQLGERRHVAIISGRGLEDLRGKLGPTSAFLVGNHGLEGISTDMSRNNGFKSACDEWKTQLKKYLSNDLGGIEIEDKHYSMAIHYRKSRQKRTTRTHVLEILDKLNPSPRIILGKDVINLVPSGAPHKGVALLEIMLKTGAKTAFYIGDDDTDEDVFTLPDQRIFTVRVGKKNSSQAKFFIRNQTEINLLLKTLISYLDPTERKQANL